MDRRVAGFGVWLCMAAAAAMLPATVCAQKKIVCWKDASGRVIGCGDSVPPEFRGSGTRELDARGITRGSTESADEAARRRAAAEQQARAKVDEGRRGTEQSRLDKALLDTYSSETEIDLKRDRDMQVLDQRLEQLRRSHRSAAERHADAGRRLAAAEKGGAAPPPALKEELARAAADRERLDKSIAATESEMEELRRRFAEYRKRYAELRAASGAPAPAPR